MKIKEIKVREILNSAGGKSLEVKIKTEFGEFISSSPKGTSSGKYEYSPNRKKSLKELKRLKGVLIQDLKDLYEIEKYFEEKNIEILPFSFSVIKALANEQGKEPYQLFGKKRRIFFLNKIIGGGKHAKMQPEIQEFLISIQEKNIEKAIKISYEIHKRVGEYLGANGRDLEGGWAVKVTNEKALETIEKVIKEIGNKKVKIGIDAAATSYFENGRYKINKKWLSREKYMDYITNIAKEFKLFYLEDPLGENDFEGFSTIKKTLKKTYVCGDDLTVTNPERLKRAIEKKSVNSIIIKPNQAGQIYKVIETCKLAEKKKILKVISHRSQETNEDILSDLGIGLNCQMMKIGLFGGERVSKINRLTAILK